MCIEAHMVETHRQCPHHQSLPTDSAKDDAPGTTKFVLHAGEVCRIHPGGGSADFIRCPRRKFRIVHHAFGSSLVAMSASSFGTTAHLLTGLRQVCVAAAPKACRRKWWLRMVSLSRGRIGPC
jgi:hypothetical protein